MLGAEISRQPKHNSERSQLHVPSPPFYTYRLNGLKEELNGTKETPFFSPAKARELTENWQRSRRSTCPRPSPAHLNMPRCSFYCWILLVVWTEFTTKLKKTDRHFSTRKSMATICNIEWTVPRSAASKNSGYMQSIEWELVDPLLSLPHIGCIHSTTRTRNGGRGLTTCRDNPHSRKMLRSDFDCSSVTISAYDSNICGV